MTCRAKKSSYSTAEAYDALLRELKALGWTADRVASHMGLTSAAISYRRSGRRQVSVESTYALRSLLRDVQRAGSAA